MKNPPEQQISAYIRGKWALKVGNAVFMFISYEPTIPVNVRNQLCDSIRGFGWSLLGIDPFPRYSPFNEITCLIYGIVCDPAVKLDLPSIDEVN